MEFLSDPDVQVAVTNILASVLTILAALAAFGARRFDLYMSEKLGAEKKERFYRDVETAGILADIFVRALKQSPAYERLALEELKALALSWMKQKIEEIGLNVDWEMADKIIEAAVQKMKAEIPPIFEPGELVVKEE